MLTLLTAIKELNISFKVANSVFTYFEIKLQTTYCHLADQNIAKKVINTVIFERARLLGDNL